MDCFTNFEIMENFNGDLLRIEEYNNIISVFINDKLVKQYDNNIVSFDQVTTKYYKRGYRF